MTLLECLEEDKERLINELKNGKNLENAEKIITAEMDRILLRHNESCEQEELRNLAACMLQTARMSAPLANCVGDTKIWEECVTAAEKKEKRSIREWRMPLLAILSGLGAVCGGLLLNPQNLRVSEVLILILASLLSLFLGFLSGKNEGKKKPLSKGSRRYLTECRVDAERVYVSLRNMLIAADQNLERHLPEKNAGAGSANETEQGRLSRKETDLLAGLLEAGYSEDGEYALEKLQDIHFYLHQKNVDTIDYNGTNRELFDFIPAAGQRTFRPALVEDGKVLRRGLASEGRV